jgi:hypothetical protein
LGGSAAFGDAGPGLTFPCSTLTHRFGTVGFLLGSCALAIGKEEELGGLDKGTGADPLRMGIAGEGGPEIFTAWLCLADGVRGNIRLTWVVANNSEKR